MSTPKVDVSPKDDKTSLNVLRNTDIAELLLVSKSFVLECWPAEEFALENGKVKKKSARSLLNGALVRLAATQQLVQITFGTKTRGGHRELEVQNLKPASVHDIMDYPWPHDSASKKVFEQALGEAIESERIKPMHVLKVATILHRLEQAKYWSGLKQRHNSQVLATKQRSAIEGQMADCMRSTEAPPAAELVAMVQAGCEEEEPGEVSEGRRAMQRHLQEIKDRQQASHTMQPPAAPARSRKRSAGPSPDQQPGQQTKASAVTPSAPDSNAIKDGTEVGCSHRQAGTTNLDSGIRLTPIKFCKSPGYSPTPANDFDKPSGDAYVQLQCQDQQPGRTRADITGRGDYGRRQQVSNINGSTAHVSASTFGKPLPGAPAVPANGHKSTPVPAANHTPTHAASDVAKRIASQAHQSVASERASKHEPVAESPGIITSATIARLAWHSTAQHPLNGKSSTVLQAPPSRGRAGPTPPPTAAGKRKSTDTHQLQPDSSGQGGQSNPALPSSQASSSSSPSPDQPAAGKRKKIMWDPQVALSQQGTGAATAPAQQAQQAQQASPSNSLQPPASKHVQAQQSAPAAPSRSLNKQLPLGSSLVQPPNGAQEPSQTVAQAADKQPDKQSSRAEEVERAAGGGAEQAGSEVGLAWSWGPGAAVQGRFDAALVSMMPGFVDDQKPGASAPPCELTFSTIVHRDEAQQQQLASTTSQLVFMVHCKGQVSCSSNKASDSSLNGTMYPGKCSLGAMNGLMEHARLRGCLESSGAALALCSGPRARENQNDGDHKAANAVADVSLEASAAANKHKPSGKQPSEMHASQQTQQSGAATDKASFTFSKASRAEATQALASVGLTSDLIEALVENFTTDQLQACLENAQQMDSSTGAATPTSETQPGAMQADPTPPAPAAELSTRRHLAGALPGTASQMSAEAAAQAADDRTGRRLLLDDVRAADASEASDAAAHVGVLLVSGSHVRHWLAATNMSELLLDSLAASCAAHSHATFAILLYLPSAPTHAPTLAPLVSPGQTSGSPMESCPRLAPPHAVQGPSNTFSADSSWLISLSGMPDSLQHSIHHSLGDSRHDTKATSRDLTTLVAIDTSQNLSLHMDGSPEPSGPPPPLATFPGLPRAPLQPSQQLHRQVRPPMLSSTIYHETPRQLSTSPDDPTQPLAKLQQEAAELEPKLAANTDAMLQSRSKKPAEQPNSWPGHEEQVREGQVREGQLRGRSELTEHKSAAEAEQLQQQQQTVSSSMQQLQQPSPSDSTAQPASLVTEAMLASSSPQQLVEPASRVAHPQKPGQTVLPNPRQTSPEAAVTRASDAVAKSDSRTLRQGSTLRQVSPCIDEPPTWGKRPEAEKGSLDPAASQLMTSRSKLPEATPSSPAASEGAATVGNSDDFAAVDPSPSRPAAQPLNPRASTSTEEASAAANASQLPADAHAARGNCPSEQAQPLPQASAQRQLPSQAPAHAVTQSLPRQKKRIYRQPSAAEASPEAKRLKQEVKLESPPPVPQQQQQQPRQEAKDTTAGQPRKVREPIRHPEQPIDLPPSAVQNIFRSIRKLRLQGDGLQLTSQHMDLMTHLPPLLQLRVLSKYASEVLPHGNVVTFFSLTVDAMSRRSRDIKWLTQRESTAKAYRLCDAAVSLCGRLEDRGMLPVKTIPAKTPQLMPLELQAAYILCVGGHVGNLSRREFADQLLVGLLGQVCIMMEEHKASEADRKTAQLNLKAAGGSPAKVQERLRQLTATRSEAQRAQRATRASEPRQLDIKSVVKGCLDGMMRLKGFHEGAVDERSMDFLHSQDSVWQLRIVSFFSRNLRPTANASAFLTSVCKFNRNEKRNNKIDWLRCTGQELHHTIQSALAQAHKAGILAKGKDTPAKIAVLPKDLHYAAVCYAIAAKSPDSSSDHAAVEDFVEFAQGLIHEVDPAAVPNYRRPTHESTLQSASQAASRAASPPPRDDKHDRPASRHSNQRSLAAGTHQAPADPRTRPPSQPPHPHAAPSQHPGGSGRDQQHRSHPGNHPRHCKYFYRIEDACTNSNCDYYHGSHQEYVAYMTHCGLVPYSLKFAGDVGRDKWIVDAAVDGLNDMILSQQLPRGSFSECELRPLAFLQDPSGEHARLQMQVVQRMKEQLPISNPVRLLHHTCQQVQAQAQTGSGGYSSMSEGYSQGPQEVFVSRGMASAPEDSFVRASSSMPPPPFANAQMFRGPADFAPSPVVPPLLPLPLALPFAPAPAEDSSDGDIPFPVLRYEEELLAGLIMLHDQGRAAESVDQLLALQPQCGMPAELARHFQGDMRERVLNFLQTRPWLFGVNPHGGISVTRLAREGLIYKRDVITYLYNAFIDNAPHVPLADINERVAQPPGMQKVIMETNGLLGLMGTQLFKDDVMLQPGPFGPHDIRLVLRSSSV